MPISLREAGNTRADNQASTSLISLGTHLADPAKRLAHIRNASSAMKSTMGRMKSILPTDFPSIGVPWLMEAAVSLYGKAKVADRIPQVANLVISNVPGPQVPLYLAGARVLTNCPTSIVVHGLALNITVQKLRRGDGLWPHGRRCRAARREGPGAGGGRGAGRVARAGTLCRNRARQHAAGWACQTPPRERQSSGSPQEPQRHRSQDSCEGRHTRAQRVTQATPG